MEKTEFIKLIYKCEDNIIDIINDNDTRDDGCQSGTASKEIIEFIIKKTIGVEEDE